MFEDRRLHQVPKPWISRSTRVARGLLIMGMFVIFLGLAIFKFGGNDPNSPKFMYAMFPLIGLILIIFSITDLVDNKDQWHLYLPYNKLLYRCFMENVPLLLNEHNLQLRQNDRVGIPKAIIRKKTGKPIARSYMINCPSTSHLKLEFGLTHTINDGNDIYSFEIRLINVTTKNLDIAKKVREIIQSYLEKIEYRKYKEVLKVTEG